MIYKRNNSPNFYMEFEVKGKRYQESTGTPDRKLAKLIEARRRAEVWQTATGIDGPKRTIAQVAARWERERGDKRSLYRDMEILRGIPNQNMLITEFASKGLLDHLQRIKQRSSASNANRSLGTLRAVLNDCYRKGELSSPTKIQQFRVEKQFAPLWLTKEQFKALDLELPRHCRPLAKFAVLTGLRWSNVAGFKWEWVKGDIAYIPAANMKTNNVVPVPLSKEALEVLASQKGRDDVYVFTDHHGRAPMKSIKTSFKLAAARIGMPALRFHDLRHSWASWHLQAGTPLHVLQKLGGWSDYKMILKTYGHWATDELATYVKKVSL